MELTLKNCATTLSKDLILLSKKNKVRECDETEKGHFIAYIDDGSESFDVSLTVKAGSKIAAHTCDCDSNEILFCQLFGGSCQGCRKKQIVLLYSIQQLY